MPSVWPKNDCVMPNSKTRLAKSLATKIRYNGFFELNQMVFRPDTSDHMWLGSMAIPHIHRLYVLFLEPRASRKAHPAANGRVTRLAVGARGGALLLSVERGGSSRLAGCPLGAADMQGARGCGRGSGDRAHHLPQRPLAGSAIRQI